MAQSEQLYTEQDPVVAQYERWLYPAPVDDLTNPSIARYLESFQTLRSLTPFYWPAGQPREDLEILVAGCGTMAAACYAMLYPQCRVLGIDFSRPSLAHQERLKERHKLANLTLQHMPVEQAASLGKQFDYISCHGVLHHLPDPPAGLRALTQVLAPEGVIGIMLYAKYGRAQVYVFQELFRMIGLEQTPQDVAVVKETLSALQPEHPLRGYLRWATDLNTDAGLVDTFLHRRDISYSVTDCINLVRGCGLAFQGWDRGFWYHPEGMLSAAPVLRERLERLPEEQLWQAMEILVGLLGTHWFYACRSDRDPATYRALWDSPNLLELVPMRAAQLVQRPGPDGKPQFAMARPNFPPVPLTVSQAGIFSHIDSQRTVAQCLMGAGLTTDHPASIDAARSLMRLLWRTGFGVLRIPRKG